MGNSAANHDAYAADYDDQVRAYVCNVADVLFSMCAAHIHPRQQLLDAGIGTGLSAELFAKAGLTVTGMDFSPAMLEVCRIKGIAGTLIRHDLLDAPWPMEQEAFDLVICCGVMHFLPDLEVIFGETRRTLRVGEWFGFTTKVSLGPPAKDCHYQRELTGGFEIFSHTEQYLNTLIRDHFFMHLKRQRCFIGEDQFYIWIVQKEQRS